MNNLLKKFILIVDDDDRLRSLLFELIEIEDFNVLSTGDGFSGLQLAKELQPDLIIFDINMPHLNVFDVLNALRKDLKTAKISFIFLTSETGLERRNRAMELGANDYLEKPVDLNKFWESIINQFQQAA